MSTRQNYFSLLLIFIYPLLLSAKTINVPSDFITIQSALDNAADGDTVLVAPGTYREQLKLENKTITFASHFIKAQETKFITSTIIDGDGETVLEINNVGKETTVVGFTIQNGDDGIYLTSKFNLLNNRIIKCNDGIDYECAKQS
jgi:hypothetical protein